MRHRTVAVTFTAALVAGAATAMLVLWQRTPPGADPSHWPIDTLAVDATVALPQVVPVAPKYLRPGEDAYQMHECPGFSMRSPVSDNARMPTTGTVTLGEEQHVLGVCLGTMEETGGARAFVANSIGRRDDVTSADATLVHSPLGELVRVDRRLESVSGLALTDWIIDHDGYTYGFGYLHPTADASFYPTAEAMIASVAWDQP